MNQHIFPEQKLDIFFPGISIGFLFCPIFETLSQILHRDYFAYTHFLFESQTQFLDTPYMPQDYKFFGSDPSVFGSARPATRNSPFGLEGLTFLYRTL